MKRPKRYRGKTRFRSVPRIAAVLVAVWLTISFALVLSLRWFEPAGSLVMWLEPGPMAEIDYHWIDRELVAEALVRAVIASEDQKFMSHFGFDLESLSDAVADYRDGGELRGASTITQQVAKNLFLWNGRSFLRKMVEAYFAVLIELLWPKERILEVYVNIAEFGPGVFGAEAASRRLLGRRADSLSPADAALLAAVLPSPKRLLAAAPSTYVRERRAEILQQMRLLEERGHYRGLVW